MNSFDFSAELKTLLLNGPYKELAKGTYLLREGETERNVYLIGSGAVRAYLLSEAEEITIRFGYAGSVINSLASFINSQPSELSLQAIRKTSCHTIDKQTLEAFVNRSAAHQQGYTTLLEQTIVQQIERETDLLTTSPTERLARVLKRSPNLFQQVPLKYIASYLRMTPETLSRIRKS
ncbi:MAG: Crp/Fnr family transcriptional regulator [Chitinophagaceae bacterium]|nr:Crp/Fnr family transcriptional regulator [Chitinophagaceae bacterium]